MPLNANKPGHSGPSHGLSHAGAQTGQARHPARCICVGLVGPQWIPTPSTALQLEGIQGEGSGIADYYVLKPLNTGKPAVPQEPRAREGSWLQGSKPPLWLK